MKKWIRRTYQNVALVAVRKVRSIILFWARQCRKSTTLGDISFDSMSSEAGRNVIAASASLLTGSELISKTLSSAEQAQMVAREAAAVQVTMQMSADASGGKLQFKCANAETGKLYAGLTAEDFADLYRSSRLELRLYFNRTAYSRTLIIAPNPATARGWTGTVVRDEAGFTHPNLEVDLQVAVKPIMDTDPTFKLIYASNLCRNDRHPFFEMTLPAPGSNFPPNAQGHFYRGQNGILIHRVALADAYAAGHVLYDQREGRPMTYEQFCADPANRLGLDDSYRLIHKASGGAAIDLFALITSQTRGIGHCVCIIIESEAEFQQGLAMIRRLVTDGPVGIGVDVATTTNETSNPTSVTLTERLGIMKAQRVVLVWKEKDPKVARGRIRSIVETVKARPAGGPARRMCIDATNEVYFARETAYELRGLIPIELVDARLAVDPVPAGYPRTPNYKTLLGDRYCVQVNDNRYLLPPEQYFKDDHRLPTKNADHYDCEPQADGRHGDTFDSGKLADWALEGARGPVAFESFSQPAGDQDADPGDRPYRIPSTTRGVICA